MEHLLGVDYGSKRIGLALADSESRLASPFKVVGSLDEVLTAAKAERVDRVIIGAPLSSSGGRSAMSKLVEEFAGALCRRSGLPVMLFDERLTSKGADSLPGTKKSKAPRDAVAAMLILQAYLDSIRR